jgi:hypothetical protein
MVSFGPSGLSLLPLSDPRRHSSAVQRICASAARARPRSVTLATRPVAGSRPLQAVVSRRTLLYTCTCRSNKPPDIETLAGAVIQRKQRALFSCGAVFAVADSARRS